MITPVRDSQFDDSSCEETRADVRRRHGFKFDGTVNLGHVITFSVGLLAGLAAWNGMDKRVTVLEEARTSQKDRDIAQDVLFRERLGDINQALGKIDLRLDKIGDQLTLVRNGK